MDKKTFLSKLQRELRHIPREDREDALSYYQEYFEEMDSADDEDVTAELGLPEEIARQIIGDCTRKHVEKQRKEGGVKNSATTIWMIVLAIFAAPIGLPLALAGVVLLLAILLVLLAVLLCAFLTAAATVFCGICLFPAVFCAGSFAQSLVCVGFCLFFSGFGILLGYGMMRLLNGSVRGIAHVFRRYFSREIA